MADLALLASLLYVFRQDDQLKEIIETRMYTIYSQAIKQGLTESITEINVYQNR